jgi:hypothetical protein
MPGLDPGIHHSSEKMDCRVKPGNDDPRCRHPRMSAIALTREKRSAAQLRR